MYCIYVSFIVGTRKQDRSFQGNYIQTVYRRWSLVAIILCLNEYIWHLIECYNMFNRYIDMFLPLKNLREQWIDSNPTLWCCVVKVKKIRRVQSPKMHVFMIKIKLYVLNIFKKPSIFICDFVNFLWIFYQFQWT